MNKETSKESTFKVYSLDGTLVGDHTLSSFNEMLKEKASNSSDHKDKMDAMVVTQARLKSALLGDKGYGYLSGYFVSHRRVKVMTKEEQKKFTDAFMTANYTRLMNMCKRGKEWDEDVFSEVILYIYDKISEVRGVNNIEATVKFKYHSTLVDNGRKAAKAFIFNDKECFDKDGDPYSMIEILATESATQDDRAGDCVKQVNEIEMTKIILDELYTNFSEDVVEMYIDYVQNFRNVRVSGASGGVSGLAVKYGLSVSTVKNKMRDIRNHWKDAIEDIMTAYHDVMYPDLDSITLKHIIHDGKQ